MEWLPCKFCTALCGTARLTHFSIQDDAEKSNGIAKHAGSDEDRKAAEAKKAKDIADMPDIVQNTIKDTMADYEYLRTKATTGSK